MFFPRKSFINKDTQKLNLIHPINKFVIKLYDKITIDFLFPKYYGIGLFNIKG